MTTNCLAEFSLSSVHAVDKSTLLSRFQAMQLPQRDVNLMLSVVLLVIYHFMNYQEATSNIG